jgi:hypothetical protein
MDILINKIQVSQKDVYTRLIFHIMCIHLFWIPCTYFKISAHYVNINQECESFGFHSGECDDVLLGFGAM